VIFAKVLLNGNITPLTIEYEQNKMTLNNLEGRFKREKCLKPGYAGLVTRDLKSRNGLKRLDWNVSIDAMSYGGILKVINSPTMTRRFETLDVVALLLGSYLKENLDQVLFVALPKEVLHRGYLLLHLLELLNPTFAIGTSAIY
jgi:hypothetical protein